MKISYFEMKEAVYIMMALLGLVLLAIAFIPFGTGVTPITQQCTSLFLLFAGSLCLFFSLTTFIIRDDPDVWR